MAVFASNASARGPFSSAAPPGIVQHAAPAGTFLSGTKVQVGTHRVIIDRYLSEGGFAHVYVVTLPRPVDGNEKAVLKRVAVPDKEHLAEMRTEVETMKRLRGHNKIVKYIDSHASQLKGGGYEVFLLMEFCQGGGLIDFMNTRLQNRLTEPEILKIFTDIAEGVAAMHYLKPVLLHRDLKVENVLISLNGSKKTFKLCDFGSSAPPRPAATNAAEARLIEDDIQRHTTMQYRSPEMIDVYRKMSIDEKSDIWALGVFLYKLCYYTTPFEDVGQSAILNAKFKYPAYPRFSDQLKLLIATMLRERPGDRPNIYQVLQKACQLDGRDLPVRDIYAHRSQSESRKDEVMPASPSSSQSRVGATLSPPLQVGPKQEVPDIAPMRRGRPTKPVSHHGSAKPSPSPLRVLDPGQSQSDPFAALDTKRGGNIDELSSKFPTLDEFSLMTDGRKKYAFDAAQKRTSQPVDSALAQRVTNALADQAFIRAPSPTKPVKPPVTEKPQIAVKSAATLEKTKSLGEVEGKVLPAIPQKSSMISTGTMTSPSPPPSAIKPISSKPIWKVPVATTTTRPASTGQAPIPSRGSEAVSDKSQSRLARLLQQDASESQGNILEHHPRSPTSSRPSLEGGRPDPKEIDLGLTRSKSLDIRKRPATVNMGAGPTHIKDQEIKRHDYEANFVSAEPDTEAAVIDSDMNITSDMEWLRAREEEERERKGHHHRKSSSHSKRTSLPHAALSGTKNILTGRFGDAFKKFEGGRHSPTGEHHGHHLHFPHRSSSVQERKHSPVLQASASTERHEDNLTLAETETEELSPEMRREFEKRQLEAEEKRVAQAAAAYRQRVASRGGGQSSPQGVNRAATIQSKVQSLISENNRPATKTATGYGKYTNEATDQRQVPAITRPAPSAKPISAPSSSVDLQVQANRSLRPTAPSKPQALRNAQIVTDGTVNQGPSVTEAISPDDWERKFHQRYPSLSTEMVEQEIGSSKVPAAKIREV